MPNADRLVSSLSGYFDDHLPPHLGSDLYDLIRRRLRCEGYPDHFHVEEVFSIALVNALRYLYEHGGANIRQPQGWLRFLCLRACIDYLKALDVHRTYNLASLLENEIQLPDVDTSVTEEYALKLLRQALKHLRKRHRRLIVLDLVKCLSPAQIQQAMQLPSNGAFRKLKHEAFTALREALLRELGVRELGGGVRKAYLFLGCGASVRKPRSDPAEAASLGATRQQLLRSADVCNSAARATATRL